ncbi:predicted protein [Botrytis cinerea T4]|uniref:Uncharacterized protein n=1 Tax=Botryotinia fuckeliana (strain T4) TaxID=999810 RepID=G2XW70_BOTF4|nr:predicted protein [Botrytis cinerea T4]
MAQDMEIVPGRAVAPSQWLTDIRSVCGRLENLCALESTTGDSVQNLICQKLPLYTLSKMSTRD